MIQNDQLDLIENEKTPLIGLAGVYWRGMIFVLGAFLAAAESLQIVCIVLRHHEAVEGLG